ncbi:hypothetical protein [Metabacillus sp. RGM 3146]|uniref:hypothetical protein n=1 Tax=Metabacillus sp. RGM 3146 TaxID=3401092 RepID=UPI003B9D8E5C
MNKKVAASLLLVPALILGGCTSNDNKTSSGQNANSSEQKPSENNTSKPAANQPEDQTSQSGSENNHSSSGASQSNQNMQGYTSLAKLKKDITAKIKSNIPYKMPSYLPKTKKYYSAAIDYKPGGYSVIIFEADKPLQLNDKALNKLGSSSRLVILTGTKYDSSKTAEPKIGYQKVSQQNTDLGHSIKGLMEGAAGSQYLTWNEGRWYMSMEASTQDQVDLQSNAKKMVTYLEFNSLPIPHQFGRILADFKKKANSAIWQSSEEVYEAKPQTEDPVSALKVITSIK